MPPISRARWTLAALVVLMPMSGCNRGGPETPYEEAVEAQEQLEEVREEAAQMISEAEQEGIEAVADARREAEQSIDEAKQEAASKVRRAEEELQEKVEQLQNEPLNPTEVTPGDTPPRAEAVPDPVGQEPVVEQKPVVDIDVETEP